jgi:hypothetical protein
MTEPNCVFDGSLPHSSSTSSPFLILAIWVPLKVLYLWSLRQLSFCVFWTSRWPASMVLFDVRHPRLWFNCIFSAPEFRKKEPASAFGGVFEHDRVNLSCANYASMNTGDSKSGLQK